MFKLVQQAYNQIMREREGGYSSQSYSQTRYGTGRSDHYGYDGDYQNQSQGGYGDFGSFWGLVHLDLVDIQEAMVAMDMAVIISMANDPTNSASEGSS